jgi:hypothetical protein
MSVTTLRLVRICTVIIIQRLPTDKVQHPCIVQLEEKGSPTNSSYLNGENRKALSFSINSWSLPFVFVLLKFAF